MFFQKLILFVVTSHSKLGDSNIPTGIYLPEVAHAYYQLSAHFQIVFASPAGGVPPIDPDYPADEETTTFFNNPVAMAALNASLPLDNIVAAQYSAVFFPGGHGPMFDLPVSVKSLEIAREIYEASGIVGGVCHGSAGILNVRLSNGEFLIAGKNVTGFSNAEEDEVGKSQYMPFMLEDELRNNGGAYSKNGVNWEEHVVVDGRLVTGQNPNSARKTAAELRKLLLI